MVQGIRFLDFNPGVNGAAPTINPDPGVIEPSEGLVPGDITEFNRDGSMVAIVDAAAKRLRYCCTSTSVEQGSLSLSSYQHLQAVGVLV